jgi:hypothetical protein
MLGGWASPSRLDGQHGELARFPPPPAHNALMRKRVQIALAVLLVAVGGVIVWQVLRSQDRSRKEYASC